MKKTLCLLMLLLLTASVAAQEKPEPIRPALLVIDVQNAYIPYMQASNIEMVYEHINWTIAMCRHSGIPVIRIYHTNPQAGPPEGTPAFEFVPAIKVEEDDARVVKNFPNAFKKTELHKILQEKGVNTLFLTGLSATGCVLATYFGGSDLDYNCFMIEGNLISGNEKQTEQIQDIVSSLDYAALKLLLQTIVK